MEILYVCTANINRSAMAAAITSRLVHERGLDARVLSASVMDRPGFAPPAHTLSALLAHGVDAAAHRSRTITADLVDGADLVLTMERVHLRTVAVLTSDAFAKTFALKEFLRRGLQVGPRLPHEAVGAYLKRVGDGRDPLALLRDDPADDVVDPQGQPRAAFTEAAAELDLLSRGVLYLLYGS